ncbi:MAG: hypothetical protein K0S12_180 [Bacteroidetes bacterium]|jgi:hypothetical protein|nr:hypothetical protein [Bacteroidota bacterium]
MRTIITILTFALLLSFKSFSQKGRGHGHGHRHGHGYGHRHGKVVVVKRSPYRPKKLVVWHPIWHPAYSCSRRWVYFPKYNIYWDNWRNHYMFWNGTIWLSQPTPPPVIVNVNLEKEKKYELKENEDDEDDVYKGNDSHKSEYKPE